MEVEEAVAGLYRLPLAEFVAARDRLARQLRAAGDREAARRVAALRRPSVSAWAANQLAQAAPHAMAELLEVGAALAQAQQDALAGRPGAARRLRSTSAQLRVLFDDGIAVWVNGTQVFGKNVDKGVFHEKYASAGRCDEAARVASPKRVQR